ncbi:MAG: alpha/beta hydrolase [Deltaproteobacteria bacterium]|nr:alpha/beta hydrolase [Deltaproteobacteria bacterium]
MSRDLLVLAVLTGLSGCMNLDWAILGGDPVDAYELPLELVPADQVAWVQFETEDGRTLHGVWAHQDPPAPPLIWFHGNGSHLGTEDYWSRVEFLWALGTHDVFAFDYRGYGLSEGPADGGMLLYDGDAAVAAVSEATGVPPEGIPWVGLSLGGAVAVHTGTRLPAQSITTVDMFLSADRSSGDATGLDLPGGWLFSEHIDNGEAIAAVQAPVFVIHGLDDTYVDPDYALELYALAPDPKELWRPEGVPHGGIEATIPEEYAARLGAWLGRW